MRGSQPRRAPTNNPPSRPEMGRTAATDSEGTNHSSKGKRKRINNTMTIGAAKKRPRRATKADSDDESLSGPDEPQQILSDNDGADKDSVITRQYVLKSNPERSNIGNIPNGPDSSAKTKKPRWTNQEKRESPHVFRKIAQHVQSINKDLYDAVGHQWLGCAEWRKEALKVLENAEKKFCLQFSISLEAYLDPRSDPALAAHVLIVRDLPKGSSESQVRKILREYAIASVHFPPTNIASQSHANAYVVLKDVKAAQIIRKIGPVTHKILGRKVKISIPAQLKALDPAVLRVKSYIDLLRAGIQSVNGTLLEKTYTINPFTGLTPDAANHGIFNQKHLDKHLRALDESEGHESETRAAEKNGIELEWDEDEEATGKEDSTVAKEDIPMDLKKKIATAIPLDAGLIRRDGTKKVHTQQTPKTALSKKERKMLKAQFAVTEAATIEFLLADKAPIERTPELMAIVQKAKDIEECRFERKVVKKIKRSKKTNDGEEDEDKLREEAATVTFKRIETSYEDMTDAEIRECLEIVRNDQLRRDTKAAKSETRKQERAEKKRARDERGALDGLMGEVKEFLETSAQVEGNSKKDVLTKKELLPNVLKRVQSKAPISSTVSLRYFSNSRQNDPVLVEERPLFHNLGSFERRPVFRFSRSRSAPSDPNLRYCMCCSEAGHQSSNCPWLQCDTCSIAGDHFAHACSESSESNTSKPDPYTEATIFSSLKVKAQSLGEISASFVPISCYSCGSDEHLGGDCPKYQHSSDQNPGIYCTSALQTYGIVPAGWDAATATRKYISDPASVFDHSANAKRLFGFNFHPGSFDQQPKKPPPKRQKFIPTHHVRYGNGR